MTAVFCLNGADIDSVLNEEMESLVPWLERPEPRPILANETGQPLLGMEGRDFLAQILDTFTHEALVTPGALALVEAIAHQIGPWSRQIPTPADPAHTLDMPAWQIFHRGDMFGRAPSAAVWTAHWTPVFQRWLDEALEALGASEQQPGHRNAIWMAACMHDTHRTKELALRLRPGPPLAMAINSQRLLTLKNIPAMQWLAKALHTHGADGHPDNLPAWARSTLAVAIASGHDILGEAEATLRTRRSSARAPVSSRTRPRP